MQGGERPDLLCLPVDPLSSIDCVSYGTPVTPFVPLEIVGYAMPWGAANWAQGMLIRQFLADASGHSGGPASSISSPAHQDFPAPLPTTALSRHREDSRGSPPRRCHFFHSSILSRNTSCPLTAFESGKRQGFAKGRQTRVFVYFYCTWFYHCKSQWTFLNFTSVISPSGEGWEKDLATQAQHEEFSADGTLSILIMLVFTWFHIFVKTHRTLHPPPARNIKFATCKLQNEKKYRSLCWLAITWGNS